MSRIQDETNSNTTQSNVGPLKVIELTAPHPPTQLLSHAYIQKRLLKCTHAHRHTQQKNKNHNTTHTYTPCTPCTICRLANIVQWMPPEALKSRQYGPATDVWAFGVTLWEMFERKDPYPAMSAIEVRAGSSARHSCCEWSLLTLFKAAVAVVGGGNPGVSPRAPPVLCVHVKLLSHCAVFPKVNGKLLGTRGRKATNIRSDIQDFRRI